VLLGTLGVVPEVGRLRGIFEFGYFVALAVNVKGTSGAAQCARRGWIVFLFGVRTFWVFKGFMVLKRLI